MAQFDTTLARALPRVGPRRIQRKRTKGWRMPRGAVYVGRPSKWGNPFRPRGGGTESLSTVALALNLPLREPELSRAAAVLRFAYQLGEVPDNLLPAVLIKAWGEDPELPFTAEDVRSELAGKDLVCWCPLGQACHAETLLMVANRPAEGDENGNLDAQGGQEAVPNG